VRLAAAALLLAAWAVPASAQWVTEEPYGVTKGGHKVTQVTLRSPHGMRVKLINYGATVTDIVVPDYLGNRENVVLGFPTLADYEARNPDYFFGGAVGRYAGRIANARFTLNGKEYRLAANDGPNTIHGGPGAFIMKMWSIETFRRFRKVGAILRYTSPAGEQGFPGKLDVKITYTLDGDDDLRIDYEAKSDAATPINFTNHSYFNLAGGGSGTVLDHLLRVDTDKLVESDPRGIPTGRFLPVAGTPFDFRKPVPLRAAMATPHPLMGERGLNHSWWLGKPGKLRTAARLRDPASGREMEVLTTEPSLTVYAAGYFPGTDIGPKGKPYRPHDAIALETQHLSDSPNRPEFPSTILKRGKTFRSTTIYRFSAWQHSRI
jgi:aldose 1-epimerase